MGWESFDAVRFDLGPVLQGQTRTQTDQVLIICLLLVLVVWDDNQLIENHGLGIL